jgi:Zn-dependent protease
MESFIFVIIVLILSIIMHEVAHGYAANALGDPTAKLAGRLTLNPIPHLDPIGSILIPGILAFTGTGVLFGWAKPVPYNPYNLKNQRWGEAIVAIAGVATNFILAIVFALIARYTSGAGLTAFADFAKIIVLVNLSLGLFNLIPIPPFDGFTFLRGILPYRYSLGFRRFEDTMRRGGILVLVLILFLFSQFLSAPFSAFVQWLFGLLVGS